ncbi:MAG: MerR family transcriptional regulator [Acidimicrobiales bacterium]
MEDRAYLSIGEVLSLLKQEFPDVTISKIRFLESQGLLDPERTPSGYRKFYETDVDRLRWILRQQREHFLPLKVIKGRLRAGHEGRSEPPVGLGTVAPSAPRLGDARGRSGSAPASSGPSTGSVASDQGESRGSRPVSAGGSGPGSTERGPAPSRPDRGPAREAVPARAAESGASLTAAEITGLTGLGEEDLKDLERFGLLSSRRVGPTTYYDEAALAVARLAAGFMKYGVEARHLRMYRTAAEREAGFFEQLITPMIKQRNPEARQQASEALEELTRLGEGLRMAMLRQSLHHPPSD